MEHERIIRHYADRGVTTIRHYADRGVTTIRQYADRVCGSMRITDEEYAASSVRAVTEDIFIMRFYLD